MCEAYMRETIKEFNRKHTREKKRREKAEALLKCAMGRLNAFVPRPDWKDVLENDIKKNGGDDNGMG